MVSTTIFDHQTKAGIGTEAGDRLAEPPAPFTRQAVYDGGIRPDG